jgi:DNA-binding XRE family transcriptional regulator
MSKRRESVLYFETGRLSRSCAERGITKQQLAAAIGVTPATTTAADAGKAISARTAFLIATYLDKLQPAPGLAGLLADEVAPAREVPVGGAA